MINLSSFPNFIKQTRKQVLDEAKVQAFKYRCYTKEDIDAFNAVNLICFCVFIAEDSLSYKVNRLVLRSHPHIIVYPEGFYDSSDQRYYTTINGLTRFFGFNFRQAWKHSQSRWKRSWGWSLVNAFGSASRREKQYWTFLGKRENGNATFYERAVLERFTQLQFDWH